MMNRLKTVFLPFILVFAAVLVADQAGAFSIKELLGLGENKETEAVDIATKEDTSVKKPNGVEQNWAKPRYDETMAVLDFKDIQNVFANINANQKQAYLQDEATFQKFVQSEADNRSVIAAAKENKVDRDANTLFLMQRNAENILRESYLTKLMAGKIPTDFPTDEQVREYYDKNKDKFVLEDRVHVWQIYLQIEKGMDKKGVAGLEKKIDSIIKEIKQGKIDFASAAMKYSNHEPSRANGGYMGLLKVSELKPGIDKMILALAEGKLSEQVKTDEGIHILKRGSVIPKQEVSYEQIQTQIQTLLKKQASAQLRQAIYNEARKTYPVELKDSKVEEWRLRLRTNVQTGSQ